VASLILLLILPSVANHLHLPSNSCPLINESIYSDYFSYFLKDPKTPTIFIIMGLCFTWNFYPHYLGL